MSIIYADVGIPKHKGVFYAYACGGSHYHWCQHVCFLYIQYLLNDDDDDDDGEFRL